jgi:hypothetical protein
LEIGVDRAPIVDVREAQLQAGLERLAPADELVNLVPEHRLVVNLAERRPLEPPIRDMAENPLRHAAGAVHAANIVQADIPLVTLPPEHMAEAAEGVVPLQQHNALAGLGEKGSNAHAADARADDVRVEARPVWLVPCVAATDGHATPGRVDGLQVARRGCGPDDVGQLVAREANEGHAGDLAELAQPNARLTCVNSRARRCATLFDGEDRPDPGARWKRDVRHC